LADWSNIKAMLKTPARHHSFDSAFSLAPVLRRIKLLANRFGAVAKAQNRFLQIAINVSPHLNDEHRVGVTQRWFHPNTKPEAIDPNTNELRGCTERGTPATAGMTTNYDPPDTPSGSGSPAEIFSLMPAVTATLSPVWCARLQRKSKDHHRQCGDSRRHCRWRNCR
jgi:hypothetical protein